MHTDALTTTAFAANTRLDSVPYFSPPTTLAKLRCEGGEPHEANELSEPAHAGKSVNTRLSGQ